jgi:glycosyltransferase involved in cell wall biosynthesis
MNILYYINGRMPSRKANGYQSSQMCKHFSLIPNVSLFLAHQKRNIYNQAFINSTISKHYNLNFKFCEKKIFCVDFVHYFEKLPFFFQLKFLHVISEYLTTFSSLISIYSFFRKLEIDYLYLRSNQVLIGFGLFFPKFFLKKIIFEVHQLNNSSLMNKLFVRYLLNTHSIVTVTKCLKEELVRRKIPSKLVTVQPDSVDLTNFSDNLPIKKARKAINLDSECMYIGYVGRFFTVGNEKGISNIIRASRLVLKKFNVKFIFIGGYSKEINLYKSYIKSLGLDDDAYIFIESKPISSLPLYLWACNILLMPYPKTKHYSCYMSPLKMFEYMASGRPIVATNLPAIKEILKHKYNSLLAKPDDCADLSKSIIALIENKKLRDLISKNALRDSKKYTWEKRSTNILKFVRR